MTIISSLKVKNVWTFFLFAQLCQRKCHDGKESCTSFSLWMVMVKSQHFFLANTDTHTHRTQLDWTFRNEFKTNFPINFWQIYFWHSIDHVDLPPSPRIFDKDHEALGLETYNLYYPYYFLRVRGTNRKTQTPFKGIILLKASFKYLYGPDWVLNHTK